MRRSRVSAIEWVGLAIGLGSLAIAGASFWRSRERATVIGTDDKYRAAVVAAARGELGQKRLDVYFADAAPQFVGLKPEWCGIFALWCLHQAGLGQFAKWKTGLGFLEVNWGPGRRLKRTTSPLPGDIAYFDKFQHQAVVDRVEGGTVYLFNGNGGGGVVTHSSRPVGDAAAYYSIQPWIDDAKGAAVA